MKPVEEELVNRLEVKKYEKHEKHENEEDIFENEVEEEEDCSCSVCRENLEIGDELICLPVCSHTFHADCLKKWLSLQSWCPVCRSEVNQEQDQEQEQSSSKCDSNTDAHMSHLQDTEA